MSTSRKGTLSKLQDATTKEVMKLLRHPRPPFGPAFSRLSGAELADALVLHRISAKYEVPNNEDAKQRRERTIRETLAYDANGVTHFDWRELDRDDRARWLSSQKWLHDTFRGFKPSYRFVPPSGESAEPGFGLVDVMFKLSDTTFWEVSVSAFPYVASIIYTNQALKAVVRKHFAKECEERSGMTPERFKDKMIQQWHASDKRVSVGYYVFSRMAMLLMSISDVSRMSTVRKNNRVDRPIDMVPFWNMVAQLSFMEDMRSHVLKTRGIDVCKLADTHKRLIENEAYATIDLKNASNSVWMAVVRPLWPKAMMDRMCALRTSTTYADIDGGIYHHYNMFGPMGCGLTFDVMTFTLWAFVQNFGFTSVFGDDIICDADGGAAVIEFLQKMKLQVNHDKTFITGSFRESCGGFRDVKEGVSLTSFDFEFPTNLVEAFALINKLRRIIEAGQCSNALLEELEDIWKTLARLVPPDFSVLEGEVGCGAVVRQIPPNRKLHQTLSEMWQRPVNLGRAVSIENTPVKGTFAAAEAAWRFAGRYYRPTKRRARQIMHTIDMATGSRIY